MSKMRYKKGGEKGGVVALWVRGGVCGGEGEERVEANENDEGQKETKRQPQTTGSQANQVQAHVARINKSCGCAIQTFLVEKSVIEREFRSLYLKSFAKRRVQIRYTTSLRFLRVSSRAALFLTR